MSSTNDLDRYSALRQVRSVIERLVRDGTAVARSDGKRHSLFPVAASAAECEALREWVLQEEATQTIEIGYGVSALHVCEGLVTNAGEAAARHVAIDPYQARRFSDCGLQFLDEAGIAGLVEHYSEESQIALPRFLGEGRSFDFAFVDGNHRFDGVFVDLFYLGRLVLPGRIVFLDDYQLPAVARAASFFVANLGWTLEEVSAADNLHQWGSPPHLRCPGRATVRPLRRLLTHASSGLLFSMLTKDDSAGQEAYITILLSRRTG